MFRSVPPPPADPALASLQLSGNDAEDRATIIAYFRKHLAQVCQGLSRRFTSACWHSLFFSAPR